MSSKNRFNCYFKIVAFGIIQILLFSTAAVAGVSSISSCQIINEQGNYILNDNITTDTWSIGNSAIGGCIQIKSNNVVFDGDNKFIIGNMAVSGTYGVIVNNGSKQVSNVTVKNLHVKNLDFGILYNKTSNVTIEKNNVTNNERGIRIFDGHNITIRYNNASFNNFSGIKLDDNSTYNNILNNIANFNQHQGGIFLEVGTEFNNISNNIVLYNKAPGIVLEHGSKNNILINNTVNFNDRSGIALRNSSSNNTLISNDASSNKRAGILFDYHSNNNLLINNTANFNNRSGISMRNHSNLNTLIGNNASWNNRSGIVILDNSILENNILSNNRGFEGEIFGRPASTGILVQGSNNRIKNNLVSDNYIGIGIFGGGPESISAINNTITGNTIINNTGITVQNKHPSSGIILFVSYENIIKNNIVLNNFFGISIFNESKNNSLEKNNVSSNERGISLNKSHNNTLKDNYVAFSNRINILVYNSTNNDIVNNYVEKSTNRGGILLEAGSEKNTIEGNIFNSNSAAGINLISSSRNNISHNEAISNNGAGIILEESSNSNRINDNFVSLNGRGIWFETSSGNVILNNTVISNSDYGFNLNNSGNNRIYHNNIHNPLQAADNTGTNFWNDSYPSGGNYWSNYDGPDNSRGPKQDQPGSDGIIDIHYAAIDGGHGAQDHYPLKNPSAWFPIAQFAINKNFVSGTQSDSLSSGFYVGDLNYVLDIGNLDDSSDSVMGNITFSAEADNITYVGWDNIAIWNKTSANWIFPPEHLIFENEGFGTDFGTNQTESRIINVSLNRWMNRTDFSTNGYQLVKFNVTFENKDFEWVWGRIEANDHNEVNATIMDGTFTTDAPGNNNTWEHGVQFDFDNSSIQPGVVYNFSVVIKVDLTGKEAPPIRFKPQFSIGMGTYYNNTVLQGYKVEMPADMLPDKISYASTSSNVNNTWLLKRHDHNIAQLDEVATTVGPRAQFTFNKNFVFGTDSDSLSNGIYQHSIKYDLNIDNRDDDSNTILENISFGAKTDNITNVDWREYATWNKTSVNWSFPQEYIIRENERFGTVFIDNRSELRSVNFNISRWMNNTVFNAEGYQLAKFNVSFNDKNFEWAWARIEANNRYGVEASIVPGTFIYENNAPGQFDVWNNGIHFNFNKKTIQTGVNYSFSVIIKVRPTGEIKHTISYKPEFFVGEGLYQDFANGGTGTGVEVPSGMLPENVYQATASTNVSNTWLVVSQGHNIAALGRDRTPPVISDFKVEPNTSISLENPPQAFANVSDENLARVEFGVIDSNNLVDTNMTLFGVYFNESGVNGKYVSKHWNVNPAHITNGTVNETITVGIDTDHPQYRLVIGYFKKNTTSNEEVAVLIFNKTFGILLDIKKQDNTSLQIENGISTFRSIISKFANGINNPPVDVSGRTFTIYDPGNENNLKLMFLPVPSGIYKVFVHATDTEGNNNGAMVDVGVSESGVVKPFLCDYCQTPTDPDNDGLYEDINGNGRKDFNDVVVFFNYMEWVEDNEPIPYFNFNGNERIDFNDIIMLFEEL